MNYPMYNSNQYYIQNLQDMRDKIDNQLRNYQQSQMQQQPSINQTFQIAPQQNGNELESKYATTIDDVKNTFVMKKGIFVTKDFSTIWVKDVSGEIKTFRTEEIVELDDKDREILALKKQINEMKEMISNANELHNTDVDEQITKTKSSGIQSRKSSNAK